MGSKTLDVIQAENFIRPCEADLVDAWFTLWKANAEQVTRLQETEPTDDPWGPGYGNVQVDLNDPSPVSEALYQFAHPDETWLDIGTGYGGTILPLANRVRKIAAVDPSPGMTRLLQDNIDRLGIKNVDVLPPEMCPPGPQLEQHDVSLAAAVVYDVPNIGEFLDAMEAHTNRLCIAVVAEGGSGFSPPEPVFELLHGEPAIRQPALREFLAVLGARRTQFEVQTIGWSNSVVDLDESWRNWWRRTYLVKEGSTKDARLRELLYEHYGVGNGQIQPPHGVGKFLALITWEPPRS